MSLWKLREERKRLGGSPKQGPRTRTLILLLILVLLLIFYLGRAG
ncbi:MAG TPA: hypothetical protein VKB18_01875 [Gemmatimonadota bacterium]|nr:hypothetical protein [Gemmatimonadota bacterium]